MEHKGLYSIIGPPGTGKTHRLTQSVQKIVAESHPGRLPALVCSLTRTAAAEVAGRNTALPPEAIGTLHSHAYAAIGRPPMVDLKAWNAENPQYPLKGGQEDVDDPYGVAPGSVAKDDSADALLAAASVMRARMIPFEQWSTHPLRVTRHNAQMIGFYRTWNEWKRERGEVDFTDMISHAIEQDTRPKGEARVILADEAQDHSALELALLKQWAAHADALLIVGDPWQALYTWRGAAPEMFVDPDIPADHQQVLPQSYRVPARVHAVAMRWVRKLSTWTSIEYRPRMNGGTRPVAGEVSYSGANCARPDALIDEAMSHLAQDQSVMIAASCGYMLEPLLHRLRDKGIPFCNPWRRKQGRWNPLRGGRGTTMAQRILAFLIPLEGAPAEGAEDGTDFAFGANEIIKAARTWTADELQIWSKHLTEAGVFNRGGKKQLADFAGQCPTVTLSVQELGRFFTEQARDALAAIVERRITVKRALDWWLEHVTGSKQQIAAFPVKVAIEQGSAMLLRQPQLYVGTIHSFKGAEADVVALFPDLSPSGWRDYATHGELRDSVVRMFYVGLTRAREKLIVCRAGSAQHVRLTDLEDL